MSFDLVIRGGRVIGGGKVSLRDVFIREGKIAALKRPSRGHVRAARVIDARGLLVLPGIIDAHAHFQLRLGPGRYTSDDFASGSAAAVCGGVTTFLDYTGQGPGESPLAGLRNRMKEAAGRCHADYSFHCMLTGWKHLRSPGEQISACVRAGAPTFKMFTAYGARGLMSDDSDLREALSEAAARGALVCVHAENGPVIDALAALMPPGAGIKSLSFTRPDFTETEAVGRVAALAAAAAAPVYFVHLSSAGSGVIVAGARAAGAKVMGETCPQYLALDERVLSRPDGHLYSCCPPVRTATDNAALWKRLKKGELQVIATDNCTFSVAQKNAWRGAIRKLPMGLPGSQTLLAAAYTYGVKAGKLSLQGLVRALCENPARIMGLKGKGFIRPGYDADLALIDPECAVKADWRRLQHRTEYSPWQGRLLYGFPRYTVLRGRVAAEAGELAEPKSFRGRFLRREEPCFI
ncbi:MAG: amidohydrolase family protein [Elusimicrobia bacterium]|nr:amidohydrolase family protein [Elusimicrobiota bacterium]